MNQSGHLLKSFFCAFCLFVAEKFSRARADMLRRLGDNEAAAESYEAALNLATNDSERRFLERRLREVRSLPQ